MQVPSTCVPLNGANCDVPQYRSESTRRAKEDIQLAIRPQASRALSITT
jgi:hypothetical protein